MLTSNFFHELILTKQLSSLICWFKSFIILRDNKIAILFKIVKKVGGLNCLLDCENIIIQSNKKSDNININSKNKLKTANYPTNLTKSN